MTDLHEVSVPAREQMKLGFGAYGPNGVQGQSPWPYSGAKSGAVVLRGGGQQALKATAHGFRYEFCIKSRKCKVMTAGLAP